MSLSKCTEYILRPTSQSFSNARTANWCSSKRQKIASHGSQSITQQRLFSWSRSKHANESPPTTDAAQRPVKTVNMSTMFNGAIGDRNNPKTSQKSSTSSTPKDTPESSLLALLSNLKPANAPIRSVLDKQGRPLRPEPLKIEAAPFQLRPELGRTVQVDESRGRDVGSAFRILEALARRNGIKRDLMSQRFHERPGLKRKRLASQRYRARFKQGFREVLSRVQAMRKMGW